MKKQGAIIGDMSMPLENACINTACYYHTSHYDKYYRNGCVMLNDVNYCIEKGCFKSIEDGLKDHEEFKKKYEERKKKGM